MDYDELQLSMYHYTDLYYTELLLTLSDLLLTLSDLQLYTTLHYTDLHYTDLQCNVPAAPGKYENLALLLMYSSSKVEQAAISSGSPRRLLDEKVSLRMCCRLPISGGRADSLFLYRCNWVSLVRDENSSGGKCSILLEPT